jgi:hypothetical protein
MIRDHKTPNRNTIHKGDRYAPASKGPIFQEIPFPTLDPENDADAALLVGLDPVAKAPLPRSGAECDINEEKTTQVQSTNVLFRTLW